MSFGVLILGHRHPAVMEAVKSQFERGLIFGAPHEMEIKFEQMFVQYVPCADMVLICNFGTEATMQGIRIMRAFSGKDKIAKFEGGFHGWHDYALWSHDPHPEKMGPPEKSVLVSDLAGIPDAVKGTMLLLPYDESAFTLVEEHACELAGVMI